MDNWGCLTRDALNSTQIDTKLTFCSVLGANINHNISTTLRSERIEFNVFRSRTRKQHCTHSDRSVGRIVEYVHINTDRGV